MAKGILKGVWGGLGGRVAYSEGSGLCSGARFVTLVELVSQNKISIQNRVEICYLRLFSDCMKSTPQTSTLRITARKNTGAGVLSFALTARSGGLGYPCT